MIGWVLVALIAALHGYIMVLEMVWWETPRAMKAFGTTPEFAAKSKVLAANQGLYNGFLVAGLVWALIVGVPGGGQGLALFFLGCVFVAGVFGAATANRRILFVQAVPAGLAILAVLMGW
jgi:putative membrane protein